MRTTATVSTSRSFQRLLCILLAIFLSIEPARASLFTAEQNALAGNALLGMNIATSVDANNRRMHKDEAEILQNLLKEAETEDEKYRLKAAACALIHCADGVPETSPEYAKLKKMQSDGQGYNDEKKRLTEAKKGSFTYKLWDRMEDRYTRNGLVRFEGGIQVLAGTVGVAGSTGLAIAACSPPSAAVSVGTSCALVGSVGAAGAGASSLFMLEGWDKAFGLLADEGANVLASFNPKSGISRTPLQDSLVELGVSTIYSAGGVVLTNMKGIAGLLRGATSKTKSLQDEHVAKTVQQFFKQLFGKKIKTKVPPGPKSNQLARRGWNQSSIDDVVNNYVHKSKTINKANDNPATAYFDKNGHYVVRDDVTGEIVQMSNRYNPNWKPDSSIIDPYKPG